MKCWKSLFAVFCILLLCGCGRNRQAIGRVTSYENGILSVQTVDGKTYNFQVDPVRTTILGLEGDEQDPLGDGTDRRVQVTYSQKQGKCIAQTIYVDSRLHRNAMTLADGTPIDIWERNSWREYCLEDGTVLLVEDNITSLENDSDWIVLLNKENVPEKTRQEILDYYSEMGQRYDIPALLENAYRVYSCSEEYANHYVSQSVDIEAWNDRIICCKMCLILPQENSNGGGEAFFEGAVFDRQTGSHIPNYDLFTVTPGELEDYLLDQLDQNGTLDRERIALNMKPEQIVLCRDGDVAFYLVNREEKGVRSQLQMDLPAKQAREILKPWARIGLESNY